jgi:hypothetical protein
VHVRGSPDRVARIGPPTLRAPTTAQRSAPLDSAAAPRRSGGCTARCNECTMQQTRPHGGRGAARVSTQSTRSSEHGQQWAGAAQWGSRTARARAAQRGAKQAERPCAPAGPRAGVKARQWLTGQAIFRCNGRCEPLAQPAALRFVGRHSGARRAESFACLRTHVGTFGVVSLASATALGVPSHSERI